jgi:hypothetical protein
MYEVLNIFFLLFHTGLVLFNLLGWVWKQTRRWNLYTLLATAFSWFVLGIWYGFGYCPCTHWHWMIRRRLGYTDMPSSYIKFLIQKWTGLDISPSVVDTGTAVFFFGALVVSIYLNSTDYKDRK